MCMNDWGFIWTPLTLLSYSTLRNFIFSGCPNMFETKLGEQVNWYAQKKPLIFQHYKQFLKIHMTIKTISNSCCWTESSITLILRFSCSKNSTRLNFSSVLMHMPSLLKYLKEVFFSSTLKTVPCLSDILLAFSST